MSKTNAQYVFIFDFDGTIADTLPMLVEISNQLAPDFGYKHITAEDIQIFRGTNTLDIFRKLEIPLYKIPLIAHEIRQRMRQHITEAPLKKGLKEILIQLQESGHPLGIVSSNSLDNVEKFLKFHNLGIFQFFRTSVGIFNKPQHLKALIQKHKLPKERLIYVGDEIRDIEAARRCGVKIAAVCWGYNTADTLAEKKPDFLIRSPEELLTLTSH